MQVVVDNLLTHYERAGRGKLVLLLHGWGDNLAGLAALQKDLADGFEVVSVDLPGFGQTQPPAVAWNLDNYAGFVRAFLQKIAAGTPYAIIGHSNGGALAVRGLALGELKADKLVLLAAAGIRHKGGVRRALLKLVAKTGNVATLWMPERYRRALRESLYGVAGSDMLVVPQLQETFKRTVRQDVQQDAAKLSLPTLLIYAENDRAVPLADAHRYQQLIKNSELQVIPGAGHFVHLDKPEQVVNAMRGFLA